MGLRISLSLLPTHNHTSLLCPTSVWKQCCVSRSHSFTRVSFELTDRGEEREGERERGEGRKRGGRKDRREGEEREGRGEEREGEGRGKREGRGEGERKGERKRGGRGKRGGRKRRLLTPG